MSGTAIVFVVTLLATAVWASNLADTGFQNYECYRDLCVSRRQYCSDREQRCKLCQPAHCINRDLTPKECVPLCAELLKPSTTTTATKAATLKTTLKPYISKTSSSPNQDTPYSTRNDSTERVEPFTSANNQNGIFVSSGVFILVSGILLLVLLVLVILGVCILCAVKNIQKRLPRNSEETIEKGRIAETEEEEALLKKDLRSGHSSKTSGSAVTVSSESTKSPSPGPCHDQQQQQHQQRQQTSAVAVKAPTGEFLPPYTARPSSQLVNEDGGHYSGIAPSSAAGMPIDSLQHQNGHSYQLMSGNGYDHVQDACFRSPPVWERSGRQDEFPYSEETCQKSV